MANDYAALKKLLTDPTQMAVVSHDDGNGTVTAITPQGNTIRLRGSATVGKAVIYQGRQILNEINAFAAVEILI